MDKPSLLSRIERVSGDLLLAEPSDLNVLARIHTDVIEMASAMPQASGALEGIAELIEQIVLNEVPDPMASMDVIARGICAFQTMVRDARSCDEAGFPCELRKGAPGAQHPKGVSTGERREKFGANIGALRGQFNDHEQQPSDKTVLEIRKSLDTLEREASHVGCNELAVMAHAAYEAFGRVQGLEMPPALRGAAAWFEQWVCGEDVEREFDALIEGLARVGEPVAARTLEHHLHEGDAGLLREFIAEAREHLHNADVHILAIEMTPGDSDAINAVFRAFHTIKGVAGFLALDEVQALAHESENVLDLARKGELELSGGYVDLVFEAVDTMKRLIQFVESALVENKPLQHEEGLWSLVERLKDAANGRSSNGPGESLIISGAGKRLGEILVEGGLARRTAVATALASQQSPEPPLLGEDLVSEIIITRSQLEEALALQAQSGNKKLGEILVAMGAATWEDIKRVLARQRDPASQRLGSLLVRSGEVSAQDVAQALRGQRATHGTSEIREAIKVDSERLDRLIDLIGELVIAESMVSQSGELTCRSQQLVRQLNQLDKITRELQQMGMALRMVPIRATFQKISRLVRDVAKKMGKKVEFITEGDDTELDKTVVDKIGDPLVHMVRNAIDHGLEASVDERVAAGKPDTGRVTLRAIHRGGSIHIEVEDDGRGLSRETILQKAREQGLAREGEILTDREVYNLLFEPGFSTAKSVTDISGRGVGMDVVRRNIESLRGQIDIQSELGHGTKFSIRLPLTLAIIDGMVVRVGTERYIVPTLSIVRSIQPGAHNIASIASRGELLIVQGDMIPLFRLHALFEIDGAERDPLKAIVLILENDGQRVGLMVDELLGQQQIVIKSLGDSMKGAYGVAGAAIMPDGTVGLIIDVGGIVRLIGEDNPDCGPEVSAA